MAFLFQSYHSSINTNQEASIERLILKFQSYHSSINTCKPFVIIVGKISFNPTIVRLIQVIRWEFMAEGISFNPTIVRLIPVNYSKKTKTFKVSILP